MSLPGSLVKLDYRLKNSVIRVFHSLLFGSIGSPETIRNILIFRTGSMGDSICSIPVIESIRRRFPLAQIALLTNTGAGHLIGIPSLMQEGIVNEYIDYLGAGKREVFAILRKRKIDLFIELPQTFATLGTNLRNMISAKSAGAKRGAGWEVYATLLFKKYQEQHNHFSNETDRLYKLLDRYHLSLERIPEYALNLNQEDIGFAVKALGEKGIPDKEKNIALIAGAKRPQNRWPTEHFKKVIEFLGSKKLNVLLIGGKEDSPIVNELRQFDNVFDFTGILTPSQSAAIMKNCRLTISNDTGPMHLSYASGTPVLAIFSSRDYPKHWFPPEDKKNSVIRLYNVPCSVCLSDTCSNNICMKQIVPEEVINKIQLYLDPA